MRRLERVLCVVTALAALAATAMLGATLAWMWRHPPAVNLTPTARGAVWHGPGLAAELQLNQGVFERLTIWREDPANGRH